MLEFHCLYHAVQVQVLHPHHHHGSRYLIVADTPLGQSTALAFNGALLAIAGGDYRGKSAIHMYQPSSNSWVKAGELPTERYTNSCIALPSGEILVAGWDGNGHLLEITSIL